MEKHVADKKKRQNRKEKATQMKDGKKEENIWKLCDMRI